MDIKEILKELEEENNKSSSNQLNLKVLLTKYLKKWHWFLISLTVFSLLSIAYVYFSTPVYLVRSSLVIKDQKKGADFTSSLLLDATASSRNMYVVENEAEVFKSESLMIKAAEELEYHHAFYRTNGPFRWKEIHDLEVPVKLVLHERRKDYFEEIDDNTLVINLVGESGFELEFPNGKKVRSKFGDKIQNFFGTFSLEKNEYYPDFLDYHEKPLKIAFFDPVGVGKYLAYNLSVDVVNKQASVLELYLNIEHPKRGEQVLNKLIELYNRESEDEKNEIAKNTIAFIDEQLLDLGSELAQIEREAEQYKLNYSITDVSAESQLFLQSTATNRQQISELSVQIDVLESIENNIIRSGNNFEMVPGTLNIIVDPTLSELITSFNELQRRREGMLRTTQPNNPIVLDLTDQLKDLRSNILENIKNIKNGLIISRNSLTASANQFQTRASKVPTIERELLDITRKQSIKQDHYLLLTQRREEALLTLASSSSNSRIIDPPSAYDDPVKPKKLLIYIFAVLLGFATPLGIIYTKDLLDDSIKVKTDVESLSTVKVIGEISRNKQKEGVLCVARGKKSLVAEQFRFIRSNIATLASKFGSKVIMVSSGMSGEGKTFFSINLGASFGLTGKSVVILELDLRKPALLTSLKMKAKYGISDVLIDANPDISKTYLHKKEIENVTLIGAGNLPEDPSELLSSTALHKVIETLRNQFDYIIIDTAPVGLVSDAFMLSELIDISIFMVRYNYTTKTQVQTIEDIKQNNRFNNPLIVLNDAETELTYGYGPKYAAGYYKV